MPITDSPERFDPEMTPQSNGDHSASQGLDLGTVFHVLREKVWLVLLLAVAGLLLAAGYIMRAPVLYSSTATLEVQQEEQKILKIDRAMDREDLRSLDVLQTIAQELKSRSLFERVIDTNNLGSDPRFVGLMKGTPSRERLAVALSKMTDVRLRRGTRLVSSCTRFPN